MFLFWPISHFLTFICHSFYIVDPSLTGFRTPFSHPVIVNMPILSSTPRTVRKKDSDSDKDWGPDTTMPKRRRNPRKTNALESGSPAQPAARRKKLTLHKSTNSHAIDLSKGRSNEREGRDAASDTESTQTTKAVSATGSVTAGKKRPFQASENDDAIPRRPKKSEEVKELLGSILENIQTSEERVERAEVLITSLEHELIKYQEALVEMEEKGTRRLAVIASLTAGKATLRAENDKLKHDLEKFKRDTDEVRHQAVLALEEAEQKNASGSQVSTASILQIWNMLQYQIHRFVVLNLKAHPEETGTQVLGMARLIKLCRENSELQGPLLEKFIWGVLVGFFRGETNIWGEKFMPAFTACYHDVKGMCCVFC